MNIQTDAVIRHAVRTIGETPIVRFPFPHMVARNLLPPDFYQKAAMLFPRITTRAEGDSSGVNLVTPETLKSMHGEQRDIWSAMRFEIYPAILDAIMIRMQSYIRKRIEELDRISFFKRRPVLENGRWIGTSFGFQVLERSEQFGIAPHLHSPFECASVLHYFPVDASARHAGTELYRIKKPFEASFGPGEYPNIAADFLEFDRTIPYLPNSALIWISTFRSIHGRSWLADMPVRRYVFSYRSFSLDAGDLAKIDPDCDGPLRATILPQRGSLRELLSFILPRG